MPDYTLKTEIGDGEVPVTIEFEYFPGTPAKDSGDPDKQSPAEEYTLEISDIVTGRDSITQLPYDIHDLLSDSWYKHIEQKCLDHVASIGEA
ncbi:MAG: hypothetical protein KUG81_09995 [Gammaproteobacteria bacterium]|nr:hypothetical protein [Gammaproteobacteria bacterium]